VNLPISDYLRRLRARVGNQLLLLPAVTGVIFDGEGRILLAKHSNAGEWGTPGGSLEPDESPADAVVRELYEETGLEVEPVRLLGVYGGPEFHVHYANGDEVSYVMCAFECRVLAGTARPDGDETLELRFVSQAESARLALPAWAQVVLPILFGSFGREPGTGFRAPTWRPPRGAQ
jgi:8-oxo-dGTP pyrophosphatase MutT (NUDIX family)